MHVLQIFKSRFIMQLKLDIKLFKKLFKFRKLLKYKN